MLVKNARGRVPLVGHVKVGNKEEKERTSAKGNKWRAPQKLPHFLVTGLERDAAENFKIDVPLMKRIAEGSGSTVPESAQVRGVPAITEIPIFFYSDEIEDVMQQSYCLYTGASINARCDGEKLTCHIDKGGKPMVPPYVTSCRGEHEGPGWKLHTQLMFGIRTNDAKFGGFYDLRTTSEISAEQLVGSLTRIKEMTYGVLQGLPLTLVVRPLQVAPEGKVTTVYVVHVEMRGADLIDIQAKALQMVTSRGQFKAQIEAARAESRRLLRAPGEGETPEEQKAIAEEFHPESIDAKPAPPAVVAAELPEGQDASDATPEAETPAPAPVEAPKRRTPAPPAAKPKADVPTTAVATPTTKAPPPPAPTTKAVGEIPF